LRKSRYGIVILMLLLAGSSVSVLGMHSDQSIHERLASSRDNLRFSIICEAEADAASTMEYGVNYLATWWHYESPPNGHLSDTVLRSDFDCFSFHGLKYVTLAVNWNYTEPSRGEYNSNALDDLERVCGIAAEYGLEVIIDFHTMMQDNSFTIPDWVYPRRFETVFTNSTTRRAWLNFLGNCTEELSGENISSWHMMNEPALGEWACNVSIEEFSALWRDMKAVIRNASSPNASVSIRFDAYTFSSSKHFGNETARTEIYDICDYVALNWYDSTSLNQTKHDTTYCLTNEQLEDLVYEIRANGREVMISEFGYDKTDIDDEQKVAYQQYVQLFRSIGVSSCVAWLWRSDYDRGAPDPPGTGFNLAQRVTNGTTYPRPAFKLLCNPITRVLSARGGHNEIFYRLYNCTTSSWEDWSVIPEGTTCDSPAAAMYSGKLYFVVRGMDGQSIWFGSVNLTDDSFSGWMLLSGASPSAPTLVNYDSKLVLVVRGFTNIIYYRSYDCISETWTEWVPVPDGATCDSPAATVYSGKLYVVVRGMDGQRLWFGSVNLTDDSFSGWTLLSGETPSAPTLVNYGSKQILVVRGFNDVIYYRSYDCISETWTEWVPVPDGATCDSPAATVVNGELHIVVRGMTGVALWHYYIDLSTDVASGWKLMDGYTPSAPTLTA
jgi:hypothetical protein